MTYAITLAKRRWAAQQGLLWKVKRPLYVAQVSLYRKFGAFDDANGLSEVIHQYDNGNFIISDDYRGMP